MAERIATLTKVTDLFGTGKHGFGPGNPPGTAATRLHQDWFNAIQEEIARAIERAGGTLQGSSHRGQLAQVMSGTMALHTLCMPWRLTQPSGGASEVLAVACDDGRPSSLDTFATTYRCAIIAVGTDCFFASYDGGENWSADKESGTATFRAVAIQRYGDGTAVVAIAVGDGGVWRRHTNGTGGEGNSSGTVSGTPDLDGIFRDDVEGLWWAWGPGGVYQGDSTPSWTQVSADDYSAGGMMRNAAGRKVFYSETNNRFEYVDGSGTSLTAGAAQATGPSGVGIYDPALDGLLFAFGSAAQAVGTDGDTVLGTLAFGSPATRCRPFRFHGHTYLALSGTGPLDLIVHSPIEPFSFDESLLVAVPVMEIESGFDLTQVRPHSFCGSFGAYRDFGGAQDAIYVSHYLPTLFGSVP